MRIYLIVAGFFFLGCQKSPDPWRDYKLVIESGRKKIPWVASVESYFPKENIDHFITHYGFGDQPLEWQTVVYFNKKYRMQIVQEVVVDYHKNEITSLAGDMKFVINEVLEIEPGNWEASYGHQVRGGPQEWGKFENSKGDLSSLPMKIEQNKPVENFEEYRKAWGKDIVK
jgi:hypothetical protein